ncbi:MAG: carboxymuconolactone decarboxylase family protein [Alphaproteobacteria bacterium]|nr:carboxymuconolactone decarboxylase family protein [Alphaproteobacteria bacterium]
MTIRIEPAAPPFAPEIEKRLAAIMPEGVPPLTLFTTLARNPRVFQRFMDGGLLDKGTLSLRQREIVIDRACARCGSSYEWGVHVAFFADRVGFTGDQIQSLATGTGNDPCWEESEGLLLKLVDALHDTNGIDDALYAALARAFSAEQLIELVVLTGFYHTVSFVTNGLKIADEAFGAPLPRAALRQRDQDGARVAGG